VEARVRDLRLEQAGWRLVHLIEPPVRDHYTAEAYAGELLARIPADGGIRAVLAYCTGAAIAQHVASGVGEHVPLMLFDGTPVSLRLIRRDFLASMAQISGQQPAAAPAGAPLTDAELTTRPAETFAWMQDTLTGLAADALREDGVDEDDLPAATVGVCAVYLDWLAFLIAGRNPDWPSWGGDVLHITSRRHAFTGQWPGARQTFLHVIDSGPNELLTSARARERTLACLGSVANSV
jgi:hypothetical protein